MKFIEVVICALLVVLFASKAFSQEERTYRCYPTNESNALGYVGLNMVSPPYSYSGSFSQLQAWVSTSDIRDTKRAWVKFDISQIPHCAEVARVRMYIYQSTASYSWFNIQFGKPSGIPTEFNMTAFNYLNSTSYGTVGRGSEKLWVDGVDITYNQSTKYTQGYHYVDLNSTALSDMQTALSNNAGYFAVCMKSQNQATETNYNPYLLSSYATTQGYKPYLEITFTATIPVFSGIQTTYYVGDTPETLPTTSDNGITGSWDAVVSTESAGTTTYTFTPDDDVCNTEATVNITVMQRTAGNNCDNYDIGDLNTNPSSFHNTYYIPINYENQGCYSYTQQLYTPAEIGSEEGIIRQVAYYFYGYSDSPGNEFPTDVNVDVYMGQTSTTSLIDWESGLVRVAANKTMEFPSTYPAWIVIPFDTDFEWDGTSNIVVGINTVTKPSLNPTYSYARFANTYDDTNGVGKAVYTSYAPECGSVIQITNGVPTRNGTPYTKSVIYRVHNDVQICIHTCTDPTVVLSQNSYMFVEGDEVSPFTNAITYNGGTTLPTGTTYSSSNTSVATVNSSGQVTVDTDNVGSSTITITIPAVGDYCQKVLTYTVVVVSSDIVKRYCVGDDEETLTGTWYDNPDCTGTPLVNPTLSTASAGTTTYYQKAVTNYLYSENNHYEYEIPSSASSLILEVWGAGGGQGKSSSTYYDGGKGGYSIGTYYVGSESTLHVYVGGQGTSATTSTSGVLAGGYNGGGMSGKSSSSSWQGGSGAGATHIATDSGLLSTLSDNSSAVLIVAGGGGGGGESSTGGAGGGENGKDGSNSYSGKGGTQSAGGANGGNATDGSFGAGGDAYATSSGTYGAGGGGAGYYGGGGGKGSGTGYSGGGGSGYVGALTGGQTFDGTQTFASISGGTETGHSGDGYARITAKAEFIVIVEDCCNLDETDITLTCDDRKVYVTWTEVNGAESYTLYYGLTSREGTDGVVVVENVQNLADHNTTAHTYKYPVPDLTNGVSYFFSIKAVSGACESDVTTEKESPCCSN